MDHRTLDRRHFLKMIAAGATATVTGTLGRSTLASPATGAAGKRRPNVVMIAIDDQNNYIGPLLGKAHTPNLDRLAAQGVNFTSAHCVSPVCNPSRTSLFTGLRPESTGQYTNLGNFRDLPGGRDWVTIPQLAQQHGYAAVAAGKLLHAVRGNGAEPRPKCDPVSWTQMRKGWAGTDPARDIYQDENGLAKWHGGQFEGYFGEQLYWGPVDQKTEDTEDWRNAEYIARYIEQASGDEPFFAAYGCFRPHSPQVAPREFFDMYPLDEVELPPMPEDDLEDVPEGHRRHSTVPIVRMMKERGELRKAVQGYLACTTFADACVGRVLDAIDRSPLKDNTIVVLWSDHGFMLGHKDRYEKFMLWRQSTQGPLMFKVPGVTQPGTRCDAAVSLLDIYPTLVELMGFDAPPQELEGISLVPWLRDPSAPREQPAVVTMGRPGSHAVVHRPWNYIRYLDGAEELYHFENDPHEFTNPAGDAQYRSVMDELARWIPKTPQHHLEHKNVHTWKALRG